jgi:hypothetical protein
MEFSDFCCIMMNDVIANRLTLDLRHDVLDRVEFSTMMPPESQLGRREEFCSTQLCLPRSKRRRAANSPTVRSSKVRSPRSLRGRQTTWRDEHPHRVVLSCRCGWRRQGERRRGGRVLLALGASPGDADDAVGAGRPTAAGISGEAAVRRRHATHHRRAGGPRSPELRRDRSCAPREALSRVVSTDPSAPEPRRAPLSLLSRSVFKRHP